MAKFKILLISIISIVIWTSCSSSGNRAEFVRDFNIAKSQTEFPIEYAPGIQMVDWELDKDQWIVIYVLKVTQQIYDATWANGFNDRTKASLVKSLQNTSVFSDLIKDYEIGYGWRYIAPNGETKECLIPYEELISIKKKIDSGDITTDGFLDIMRQQIESTNFPLAIAPQMNWVSGNVTENAVNYIYRYTVPIDKSQITAEAIENMKQAMLTDQMKEMFSAFKNDMRANGYSLNYIFEDMDGDRLYTLTITADDL